MRSERASKAGGAGRPAAPQGPTASRTALGGVRVVIPGLLLESEANERGHARAKARRTAAQRAAVGSTLRVLGGAAVPLPCRVVVTRVAPLPLDSDNLTGSAKHVRDELAVWLNPKVIAKGKKRGQVTGDDRDPRVEWLVAQEKGPAAVVIEVAPVVAWSPDVVSARAALEGPLTVAELTLDPARLRALARRLDALADGGGAFTYRAPGSVLALRFHRTKETPQ